MSGGRDQAGARLGVGGRRVGTGTGVGRVVEEAGAEEPRRAASLVAVAGSRHQGKWSPARVSEQTLAALGVRGMSGE